MTQKDGIGVGIVGMGVFLPDEIRTNDWWSDEFVAEHLRSLDTDVVTAPARAAAEGSTEVDAEIATYAARFAGDPFRGARERRVIAEGDASSDMEVRAAQLALSDAELGVDEVDLLISYSLVPDYAVPGNHGLIAHKLGMSHRVTSMTVAAGCASFVPGIKTAARLIQSGEHRTALVVQSSASSRVVDWRRPASINAGDAAVATVVQAVEGGFGYVHSCLETWGDLHPALRLAAPGAHQVPWYRGDLHQAHLVAQTMDPASTLRSAGRSMTLCRDTCGRALGEAGYTAADVAFFACSQPTAWFVEACCAAAGIDPGRTLDTFRSFAHPMSASAPINLYTAYREGRLKRGDLVLLYTPGAGFILGALLLRWLPPGGARGAPRAE